MITLGQHFDYVPRPVPGSHVAESAFFHDFYRTLQLFLGLRSPQHHLLLRLVFRRHWQLPFHKVQESGVAKGFKLPLRPYLQVNEWYFKLSEIEGL
jgi:hypothetical protein